LATSQHPDRRLSQMQVTRLLQAALERLLTAVRGGEEWTT
jgi:hypothetical protein